MACSTRKVIELSVKGLLFFILLLFYYFFYLGEALSQYNEKRTTIAESIKSVDQLDYPVLIFCPNPGFKLSFFEEMKKYKDTKYPGVEKYIWKFKHHKRLLKNVSSIPDVYKNMSFELGVDWDISLIPFSVFDDRY